MDIELSNDELLLLETLLTKEESDTRIEILHAGSFEYKEYLRQREELMRKLLEKLRSALEVVKPDWQKARLPP